MLEALGAQCGVDVLQLGQRADGGSFENVGGYIDDAFCGLLSLKDVWDWWGKKGGQEGEESETANIILEGTM